MVNLPIFKLIQTFLNISKYEPKILRKKNMLSNPIHQFQIWFNEYKKLCPHEPFHTFTLSTCYNGKPYSRTVVLKQLNDSGFGFFTNHPSNKSSNKTPASSQIPCFLTPGTPLFLDFFQGNTPKSRNFSGLPRNFVVIFQDW